MVGLLLLSIVIAPTQIIAAIQLQPELPLGNIQLPPGFEIEIYADDVPGARSMALGYEGTLFVGTRQNTVYALVDSDDDNRADEMYIISDTLFVPNGVAFKEGALYVAELNRILRFDMIETNLVDTPQPDVVYDEFPGESHHGWKYLRFGPDGMIYTPVGVPCNVCEVDDERFGIISRMKPDGSDYKVFAQGVRNTVGFDWHPETDELWFTDNGRDWISDDLPPDELNHVPEAGMHFGFPYCHGGFLVDIDFGTEGDCDIYTPPAQNLGPHVASLGMRFYTGEMFPDEYRNQIFIAEHGSWNRTVPIGYRITLVRLDEDGKAVSYEIFAEGWLQNQQDVWGRPVDVLVMPDGALLISDDVAGVIYRISYSG
jgi:glucose/arabinose dehydrogenase